MKGLYSKTIGYSPLEDVDEQKMLDVIKVNKKIIAGYYSPAPKDLVLVAGAGQGQEAVLIHREYRLMTIGIDLNIENLRSRDVNGDMLFQKQDITSLAFPNDIFSLIYCYHVLEHVDDHLVALREMQRVLKPGGVLFTGFPNKNRLLSYIGTSQKVSIADKIKWNLNDYHYRLMGKFENRFGAHAGFTEKEFLYFASQVFSVVHSVRDQYMLYKYRKYLAPIKFLIKSKMNEFVFPSNYYICIKRLN